MLVIRYQAAWPVVDTKMVEEYVLLDPHMIDGVSLSLLIYEYQSWSWEIHHDRSLDLDNKHLYFDIDEYDLLEDNKDVFMVDTYSSSLWELLTVTIS